MIKFFRNIRRRLLRENRFTRYLIYAIGEIILVVIGILIAVQLNNWNQSDKEEKLANQYLKNIQFDLNQDLESLERVETLVNDRRRAATSILNSLDSNDYKNPGVFLFQVDNAGRYGIPQRARATYEDLIATGNIQFIPKSTREKVTAYYRLDDVMQSNQELQKVRVFDRYLPYAVSAMPLGAQRWIYIIQDTNADPSKYPDSIVPFAEQTLRALKNESEVKDALKAVIRGTWSEDRLIIRHREEINKLLQHLKT
ncbi:hypothetical protein E0K83_01635 [Gramella sp. BOM4]|nr:hypothetical protein [Christiangramia bathymodioli]